MNVIPVLETTDLTKRFYGATALDAVDFTLMPGEIHALAGENGAGKSTFIKLLAGIYTPESGKICIDGHPVDPSRDTLPIGFVHQDLAFAEDLSVSENIAMVAGYPQRGGLINWRRAAELTAEIYALMNVEPVAPDRLVSSLNVSEKAMLNIVRALANTPKVLVLDEPTAALHEADSQHLFDVMRGLRDRGTSMIYVSHRLNDFFGMCDRVTVLRDGTRISTCALAESSTDSIVDEMLGKTVSRSHHAITGDNKGAPVLSLNDLKVENRGPVSFDLHPGEILGLVGLRGGGQEAIGRAISGDLLVQSGQITFKGEVLPRIRSIRSTIAKGIALLPGDRNAESTLHGMSLSENLFANPQMRADWSGRLLTPSKERHETAMRLEQFDVRPRDPDALIDWLSGGNQQKLFIARWLEVKADVLVLEEPSAGVDIGAKIAIHEILRKQANNGTALMVVSSDLEEVAMLCSRAIIVDRGRSCAELSGAEITVDALTKVSSEVGSSAITADI